MAKSETTQPKKKLRGPMILHSHLDEEPYITADGKVRRTSEDIQEFLKHAREGT